MRAIALAGLLLACAPGLRAAGEADPDAAAERIYRGHCAACHRLLDPGDYTAERWERAVGWFGPEARLTGEERRLVLHWLTARAKKPREDGGAP